MNKLQFNKIELICPCCRQMRGSQLFTSTLSLDKVFTYKNDTIIEGFLLCNNLECNTRFPIIQSIPVILTDLPSWYSSLPKEIAISSLLGNELKSYLSNLQVYTEEQLEQRKLMNIYLQLHYGKIDPTILNNINNDDFWNITTTLPIKSNPDIMLDIGCSTGRLSFEMAKHTDLCIGIDTNLHMLLKANEIRSTGKIGFDKCRGGNQFDYCETNFDARDNTLFILTDILNPPFRMESFDFIAGLNIIDNISNPMTFLGQVDALLKPDGLLLLSSPYEWRQEITQESEWFDQKELHADQFIIDILQNNIYPELNFHYQILKEHKYIPWVLMHSLRRYSLYLVQVLWGQKNTLKK